MHKFKTDIIIKTIHYEELKLMGNNIDCDICFDNKQDAFKLMFDKHKCNINICINCLEKIKIKEICLPFKYKESSHEYNMLYVCPLCRKNIFLFVVNSKN